MKFIVLFFVFCIQLPVKAEEVTPIIQTIPVKKGDVIQYPQDAQPVEVRAIMPHDVGECTVMPGDSFEVFEIDSSRKHPSGTFNIDVKKIEGTLENPTICPIGSKTEAKGIQVIVEGPEGISNKVNKIFSPVVFDEDLMNFIVASLSFKFFSTLEDEYTKIVASCDTGEYDNIFYQIRNSYCVEKSSIEQAKREIELGLITEDQETKNKRLEELEIRLLSYKRKLIDDLILKIAKALTDVQGKDLEPIILFVIKSFTDSVLFGFFRDDLIKSSH